MDDLKRKATSTKLAGGVALAWFLVEQGTDLSAILAVVVFGIYATSEVVEKAIKARE